MEITKRTALIKIGVFRIAFYFYFLIKTRIIFNSSIVDQYCRESPYFEFFFCLRKQIKIHTRHLDLSVEFDYHFRQDGHGMFGLTYELTCFCYYY